MFIPYRVDVPFNYRPVVNWVVVGLVVLVFALQVAESADCADRATTPQEYVEYMENATWPQFILRGWGIKGLFGHMWLHGGPFHLIGNLIFLWLFGNAVCSKIGNLLYLPTYIGLGLVAAISYLLFFDMPMLGASGAINGMVGMYLVFFPENSISCFYFILWHPIRVRSFWMVLLWFAFDIFGAMYGGAGVAYLAHIGGFVAGFALAVLLLKTKVIAMERDEKSILELLGLEKKDTPAERRGDYAYWQQEWRGEEKGPGDEKQQMQEEAPERQAGVFETQEPPERFIHFTCRCGQRVKMPGKYAGLIGRCPKCSARLKIPGGQEDIE